MPDANVEQTRRVRRLRDSATVAVASAGVLLIGTSGIVLAHSTLGVAQSFTFLQSGFTQAIVGVIPTFLGGIAFAPDGDPLVDACFGSNGPLFRFDRQGTVFVVNMTPLRPVSMLPASNTGCGLVNHPNGTLYTNTFDGVLQLETTTGAVIRGPAGPEGNALGIAVDPQTANIVYVGADGNIYALNPALTSSTIFSTVTALDFIDGIAFDPTGNFLFLANQFPTELIILRRDGTLVQRIAMNTTPDGIAFHASPTPFVVTADNEGTLTRFDFPGNNYTSAPVQSTFASGGFRSDLVEVGPDACLYVTQNGTRYNNGVVTDENSLVRICGGFAPPRLAVPRSKDDCKELMWRMWAGPAGLFKNQGQCIKYVNGAGQ